MSAGRRLNVVSFILVVLTLYQGASVLLNTLHRVPRHVSYLLMLGALALAGLGTLVLPLGTGSFRSRPAIVTLEGQDEESSSGRSAQPPMLSVNC